MTATNFRDLLAGWLSGDPRFGALPGDYADADEILALPVPWVDCPTCDALGWVGGPTPDGADPCDTCPACTGTGKATVAQLLAWGQAVAQDLTSEWCDHDFPFDAVDEYRNRILDVQP